MKYRYFVSSTGKYENGNYEFFDFIYDSDHKILSMADINCIRDKIRMIHKTRIVTILNIALLAEVPDQIDLV